MSRPANVAVRPADAPGGLVLTVKGALDARTGRALVAAVNQAVADGAGRLDVDLTEITSFTDEGATALRTCCTATDALTRGLHYRTNGPPGREALVTAFAEDDEHDPPDLGA